MIPFLRPLKFTNLTEKKIKQMNHAEPWLVATVHMAYSCYKNQYMREKLASTR